MIDSEVITIHEFLDPRFFSEFFVYHIRGIANVKGLTFLEDKLHQFDITNRMNHR